MTTATDCIGCERWVAVGTRAFIGRVAHGDRYLCAECAELFRTSSPDAAATDPVLRRIQDYGVGMAGGYTGALGGPG